jgi:hypothetical protein
VALTDWAMWALGFTGTVVAVHVVIASHKRRVTARRALVWIALLVGCGVGLAIGAALQARFLAASPLWVAAAAITVARPPATRLRRVGVLLAVTATVATGWLVAAGV